MRRGKEEEGPLRKSARIDWGSPLVDLATRAIQKEDKLMLLRIMCHARAQHLGLQNFLLNDFIPLVPPNLFLYRLIARICVCPTYENVCELCGYTLKYTASKSPRHHAEHVKKNMSAREIERCREELVEALQKQQINAAIQRVSMFKQCGNSEVVLRPIPDMSPEFEQMLAASGYFISDMRDVWHAVFTVVKNDDPELFTLCILLSEHRHPNVVINLVHALCSKTRLPYEELMFTETCKMRLHWATYEPEGLPAVYGIK